MAQWEHWLYSLEDVSSNSKLLSKPGVADCAWTLMLGKSGPRSLWVSRPKQRAGSSVGDPSQGNKVRATGEACYPALASAWAHVGCTPTHLHAGTTHKHIPCTLIFQRVYKIQKPYCIKFSFHACLLRGSLLGTRTRKKPSGKRQPQKEPRSNVMSG